MREINTVEEWLGKYNKLGIDIWKNKYQYNNETFNEWLDRVSDGNKEIRQLILDKKFLFGGRILANRGLDKLGKKVTYSNCYVLGTDDSIEDIYQTCSDLARTFSYGGGVGVDISKLRPKDAHVNNTAMKTSGACSFMDTFSQVTETIGQNGRRGALMLSMDCTHPELEEFINIKNDLDKVTKANISVKVTDDFMNAVLNDLDWELSFETKHETIKKTVNARKIFDMLCENNWNMAEPGLLFWDRIDKYNLISEDETFEYGGVNPCFTGDMKLLTHEGYKTLEELCDTEPLIYSYDGLVSKGKVWCNGEKDTIKLTMSNNKEITCTPDHRFMTIDGEECEAKNLKNKKIMPKVYKTIKDDELFIKLGFIQGDGQLSRLDSEYHKGMEVNIGVRDGDIKYLFENDNYTIKSHRAIYLQGYNDLLEKLQFSHEVLPNRTMPKAYYEWDLNKKSNFLQGCFSANGCVNSNKRISYKTTCKEFAQELMDTLEKDFNITANLTVNKKHMVEFESGEYECRESYDVNVSKYNDIMLFSQYINFYQKYKKIKLVKLIEARVPYVRSIKENGKELVYDFKESINHWGVIEGFVAHNCAEEPLPIGGSCLLGSINLSEYVNDKKFDLQTFILDVHKIVRGMNDVLDQGLKLHPLEIQRETVRDWRQIGIGIMGIADMLIKMGIKYGSDESLSICDSIGFELANASILASSLIAKERGGVYPKYSEEAIIKSKFLYDNTTESTREVVKENGLANSQILTIAPCGSLSTMIGISGGIEPIFSLSYTRKTESLHEDGDVYYKVYTPIAEEYMKEHNLKEEEDLPNFFVTAQTLNPFKRVEMQSMWQNHIDASISSTVNLPNESTIEDVKELYIHAWKSGLKGMTIYRDGCARSGVLTLSDKDNKEEIKELKRGEWEDKPKGCIEISKKIYSGCGKMTLHIGILPKEKRVFDVYVTNSSKGGCTLNIQNIAITISNLLRIGGNLKSLEKSFEGAGSCPSFATARAKNRKVSKGNSCGSAILNILLDVERDLQNECLEELQELGCYNKSDNAESVDVDGFNIPIDTLEKITNTTYTKVDNYDVKFTQEEIKFIQENGESAFAQRYNKCPICGEKDAFNHVGGCVQCNSCSWTRCD